MAGQKHRADNESLYPAGPRAEKMIPVADRWNQWLEKHSSPGVPFYAAGHVPFGTSWNVAKLYGEYRTLPQLAADYPFVRAAFTLEIPFANLRERTFSCESQRLFGENLAHLILEELNA